MNAVELYNTVNNYLMDLRNTYGDNIEYIEAYDGRIIAHFKKEYLEVKLASQVLKDLIGVISKTIWCVKTNGN